MLDQWLKEDLEDKFNQSDIVVLIDIDKEYDFIVDNLMKKMNLEVYQVTDFVSDLEVKYLIEKNSAEKVLIHSSINPSDPKKRHFMIQEYVVTGGSFNRPLARYIREKANLLNTKNKLTDNEILIAGQMSLKSENNNEEYWLNIVNKGKEALLGDFTEVVLGFLNNPEQFLDALPEGGRELLYQLIGNYLDHTPEKGTDPEIVADTFAKKVFNNIIEGKEETQYLYKNWIDSHKHRESLKKYLSEFDLPDNIDVWKVDPNHPFIKIDEKWLEELGKIILGNKKVPEKIVKAIDIRNNKAEGMELAGSEYWGYIHEILTFQAKLPHKINDLPEFIELYKNNLFKLDQAFRHLNKMFLTKNDIRAGFNALYKEKMNPYLNRWFDLFSNYRENQSDYLYREIFSKNQRKAVIIGDAISYEVSQEILGYFNNDSSFECISKIINGNYPSTTENNMSALFGSPLSSSRSERESFLNQKFDDELQVYNIDSIDLAKIEVSKPLIIYGSDIDMISEKGHEAALKYYSVFIDTVVTKIKELLELGYNEVHLTTDHGFICDFDIEEADKFSAPVKGKIHDRYVASDDNIDNIENFIMKENTNGEYKYNYFPKGMNPIKSRGKYGFSHGGITPQEVLLPHLIIKKESNSQLQVSIQNRNQLKEIGANTFSIKLRAEEASNLFKQPREIVIKIESNNVTKFSQKTVISPGENYSFDIQLDLNKYTILVQDAISKEILDSVKGQKQQLRGGIDGFDIN